MKIFFDTEFIEDGETIDLISIGLVKKDGSFYYAENSDCDLSRASPWVKANVIPHLHGLAIPKARIAADIVEFSGESPEFWAYFADYDWVVLCQLYGTMMDLPDTWPMYCMDIMNIAKWYGIKQASFPKIEGQAHKAIDDAFWCKSVYEQCLPGLDVNHLG